MSVSIKKVLISDNVDKKCEDLLKNNGIEVVSKFNLSSSDLIKQLQNCDGLIVRSDTKVTKEIIEQAKSLKVIGRAGTGVDNIDTTEATKKGIIVLNAPNGNSVSACELACSFISSLARNVTGGCQSVKDGKWDRKAFSAGSELMGKTLGIIGLGRIGREVAIRMQAYGMQIVGYDPFISSEEAKRYSIQLLQLEEIWPIADYVTVHTPLIPQTKNLINQLVFSKCKQGVKIVNAARGGIVNESDLLQALEDGKCGGAALDVFSEEPPKSDLLRKLISHPRVIATPHIGASTKEAQTRVAVEVAEQFISLNNLTSKYQITGVLNAPALLASRQSQNTAWLNLSEQLGRIISRIAREEGILKGADIKICLTGPDVSNMKFLSTSILLGVLSGKVKSGGYNLVNTPVHANEAGLNFAFEDGKMNVEEKAVRNVIKISISNNTLPISIQGTVNEDVPYLLQLNDAIFPAATVQLTEDIQIYSTKSENLSNAISSVVAQNKKIHTLAVAYGELCWIAVSAEAISNQKTTLNNVQCY